MPVPNFVVTSGTAAQTALINQAGLVGINEPVGGLSPADFQAWAIAEAIKAAVAPAAVFVTSALAGPVTASVGQLSGAPSVNFTTTNAAPGTVTTRTAAQLFADVAQAIPGYAYMLRLTNTGAGTLTLAGGVGVTINGTATVPVNTFRDFVVTLTSAAAVTMQAVATGTFS